MLKRIEKEKKGTIIEIIEKVKQLSPFLLNSNLKVSKSDKVKGEENKGKEIVLNEKEEVMTNG